MTVNGDNMIRQAEATAKAVQIKRLMLDDHVMRFDIGKVKETPKASEVLRDYGNLEAMIERHRTGMQGADVDEIVSNLRAIAQGRGIVVSEFKCGSRKVDGVLVKDIVIVTVLNHGTTEIMRHDEFDDSKYDESLYEDWA